MESRGGGGSDPALAGYRVGPAALVAPTPRHTRYSENIWHRYRTHLRWIRTGSVQHRSISQPGQIRTRSPLHPQETT